MLLTRYQCHGVLGSFNGIVLKTTRYLSIYSNSNSNNRDNDSDIVDDIIDDIEYNLGEILPITTEIISIVTAMLSSTHLLDTVTTYNGSDNRQDRDIDMDMDIDIDASEKVSYDQVPLLLKLLADLAGINLRQVILTSGTMTINEICMLTLTKTLDLIYQLVLKLCISPSYGTLVIKLISVMEKLIEIMIEIRPFSIGDMLATPIDKYSTMLSTLCDDMLKKSWIEECEKKKNLLGNKDISLLVKYHITRSRSQVERIEYFTTDVLPLLLDTVDNNGPCEDYITLTGNSFVYYYSPLLRELNNSWSKLYNEYTARTNNKDTRDNDDDNYSDGELRDILIELKSMITSFHELIKYTKSFNKKTIVIAGIYLSIFISK
jgi:hypothetical protein